MGNRQRIGIFVVIGIFMASIFGSAIFFLAGQDSNGYHEVMYAEVPEQQPFLVSISVCQDLAQRQMDQQMGRPSVMDFIGKQIMMSHSW